MTIKEIANSLQNEKANSKQWESLIHAEAQLIKATMPEFKDLSVEEIATRRYTQSPAHSQLAAVNTFSLAAQVVNGLVLNIDNKFLQLAEKILITGEDLSLMEWKYHTTDEDIERVRKDSAGLRASRGDIENEFQRFVSGDITEESFWEYVEGIESSLAQHMYDEDYLEEKSKTLAYPERS